MLHYLLVTGTTSDIGAVLPTLVSLQKNFSYCISNNTVNFCSNCKNGGYSKSKVDKGLPLNTSAKVSSCADETTSLSYSPIRSISTIIPKRNDNKDESSYVLSINNCKKTTGLTYSSTKSVTNSPKEDNRMDESPGADVPNPTTNLPVSSIPSVSKPIQDKQTNESPSRSVSADECMEQTTNLFGSSKMSLPNVIPSQNEYTDKRLKTIAHIPPDLDLDSHQLESINIPDTVLDAKDSSPIRFLAERVAGFSRYILSHRHLETGKEYRFCYMSMFRSGVPVYRCIRSQFGTKLHCSKYIRVENGYFLANPAVGHTCLAMKSTTERPIRILAERAPRASNSLLYRHPETGQEYRFYYVNTLRSGVQFYRCTRNKIGTKNKCSRSIHVENGYFLANPAAGHNFDMNGNQHLVISGTLADIASLVPSLVLAQRNVTFSISHSEVHFGSNCINELNSEYNENGSSVNTSSSCSNCTNNAASLSYSSIKSVSIMPTYDIPKELNVGTVDSVTPPSPAFDQNIPAKKARKGSRLLSKKENQIRILAERASEASSKLLYRHVETGREYHFYHHSTLRSGIQYYRCFGNGYGTKTKAKCNKKIHVENGYFLANPAIGHTCMAM